MSPCCSCAFVITQQWEEKLVFCWHFLFLAVCVSSYSFVELLNSVHISLSDYPKQKTLLEKLRCCSSELQKKCSVDQSWEWGNEKPDSKFKGLSWGSTRDFMLINFICGTNWNFHELSLSQAQVLKQDLILNKAQKSVVWAYTPDFICSTWQVWSILAKDNSPDFM